MNPFLLALIQAGIISRTDAERMNRSLDPDAARAWAEQQLAIAMQNGLSAQQTRLVDMVRRTNGSLSARQLDTFWAAEDDRLYASILGTWDNIATERAIGLVVSAGGDTSTWQHVNQAVLDWMHGYYTSPDPDFVGSVPNLNQTSRQQVADAYGRWARGELDNNRGLPTLIQALEPTFGPRRAATIGVTEATRVNSEATVAAARADDTVTHLMWHTAADEVVCPICSPKNNQTVRKGETFDIGMPPAHVNCRCFLSEETAETMKIAVRGAQGVAPTPTPVQAKQKPPVPPEPEYLQIVPKSIRQYVPDDIAQNIPASGQLHDLAEGSLNRMALLDRQRNEPFTEGGATGRLAEYYADYKHLPSDELNKIYDAQYMARLRLKDSLSKSDFKKYGNDEAARLTVPTYAGFTDRLEAAGREVTFRREWYREMRRVASIAEGGKSGLIVLSESDMTDLLAHVGDVYIDAGWIPGKGKPGYNPDQFRTSDLSGAKIRHYVTFPNGQIGHPDELNEARQRGRVQIVGEIKPPARDWTKRDD